MSHTIPEGIAKLTSTQKNFLDRHGVPTSKVLNATGMKRAAYQALMKPGGFQVAVGVAPCAKGGHRMRNRFGHCLQCNPAAFAFERRYEQSAAVYVAQSNRTGMLKSANAVSIATATAVPTTGASCIGNTVSGPQG